eukprot:1812294-Amphidinium_carterae.1
MLKGPTTAGRVGNSAVLPLFAPEAKWGPERIRECAFRCQPANRKRALQDRPQGPPTPGWRAGLHGSGKNGLQVRPQASTRRRLGVQVRPHPNANNPSIEGALESRDTKRSRSQSRHKKERKGVPWTAEKALQAREAKALAARLAQVEAQQRDKADRAAAAADGGAGPVPKSGRAPGAREMADIKQAVAEDGSLLLEVPPSTRGRLGETDLRKLVAQGKTATANELHTIRRHFHFRYRRVPEPAERDCLGKSLTVTGRCRSPGRHWPTGARSCRSEPPLSRSGRRVEGQKLSSRAGRRLLRKRLHLNQALCKMLCLRAQMPCRCKPLPKLKKKRETPRAYFGIREKSGFNPRRGRDKRGIWHYPRSGRDSAIGESRLGRLHYKEMQKGWATANFFKEREAELITPKLETLASPRQAGEARWIGALLLCFGRLILPGQAGRDTGPASPSSAFPF